MQEKEIKTDAAENEDSPMYDYLLRLSHENPIEAQAIDLIQNRDKLDYPTVKSFLLKRILRFRETESMEMKMKPDGARDDKIQSVLEKLSKDIESLQKEMADIKESNSQALQEEEPQSSVSAAEETSDDDMDLLGIDDNFADNLLSDME